MAAAAGGEEGAGLRRAQRSSQKGKRERSRRLLTCLAAPSAAAAGRGLQSKPLYRSHGPQTASLPQRPPDPEPALAQLPSPTAPPALRSHFRRHLGYRRADSPRHCGALARRPGAAQLFWRPPALPPPSSSASPSSFCGAGPASPAWLASPRRGRVPGPGRARWQRRRRQLLRLPPSRP